MIRGIQTTKCVETLHKINTDGLFLNPTKVQKLQQKFPYILQCFKKKHFLPENFCSEK